MPALQQRDSRESDPRGIPVQVTAPVNDTTAIRPSAAHINDTRLPTNLLQCQLSLRLSWLIAIHPLY